MMKAPFTGSVADCFNIVRHIQRTATITCSCNMPLSNRNHRLIELAIGIYYFRSGAIGLVLQVEAGLHAPMPKHFHHTLSSVISYITSLSGGSNTHWLCTSYVSLCGVDRSPDCFVCSLVSAACLMLLSVPQKSHTFSSLEILCGNWLSIVLHVYYTTFNRALSNT
jgi:hypothetical protein